MTTLHIANTFFEWELENAAPLDLAEAFAQHAVFNQLQFLPLLYASPKDRVLISNTADPLYLSTLHFNTPSLYCLSNEEKIPIKHIESWGPSLLIARWAKKHALNYCTPDWDIVKQVHSKQFSFEQGAKLPQAKLLFNETHYEQWLSEIKGKKVLKSCFGTSGKGHLIIDEKSNEEKRIFSFLQKEWNKNLPVIAEPWVERFLDFSTQWIIEKEGTLSYVGATLCKNTQRGQYESNIVGDEELLFDSDIEFLEEHKHIVLPVLETMKKRGWFGHLGIDAFVYKQEGKKTLHPLVEINARKTMGFVALMIQKHHFPKEIVQISYTQNTSGHLPSYITSSKGKTTFFKRNLQIEHNSPKRDIVK